MHLFELGGIEKTYSVRIKFQFHETGWAVAGFQNVDGGFTFVPHVHVVTEELTNEPQNYVSENCHRSYSRSPNCRSRSWHSIFPMRASNPQISGNRLEGRGVRVGRSFRKFQPATKFIVERRLGKYCVALGDRLFLRTAAWVPALSGLPLRRFEMIRSALVFERVSLRVLRHAIWGSAGVAAACLDWRVPAVNRLTLEV
jgi:hypothetical protein